MAEYIILIVLIVLVVALFVVSYMRKRKFSGELSQMRADLKIGDKVMTDTGVVGEVVDSYVEDEYKYFVLKSGRGNNVGYFAVHANAIYYVFGKEQTQAAAAPKQAVKTQPAAKPAAEVKPVEQPTETAETAPKTTKPRTTRKKK